MMTFFCCSSAHNSVDFLSSKTGDDLFCSFVRNLAIFTHIRQHFSCMEYFRNILLGGGRGGGTLFWGSARSSSPPPPPLAPSLFGGGERERKFYIIYIERYLGFVIYVLKALKLK